jgi:deoxyribodipyrimidine photo-lyase
LLDYDANVNIGNRQRSASVGADPKPLRIFSPMLQSERFDTECQYIKRWVPELRDIPSAMIHNPLKYPLGYAKPIVDHALRSKLAKDMYMKKNQFGG